MISRFKHKKAFTLVELIVVIAAIGILVLLAAPKLLNHTKDARVAQIQNDVKIIEGKIGAQIVDSESKGEDYFEDLDKLDSQEISDFKEYAEGGALFDKKGLVGHFESNSDLYKLPGQLKKDVKSELPGEFYINEGGKAYYLDKSLSENGVSRVATFDLDEKNQQEQVHVIKLDDVHFIDKITSDNGDVEVVSIDGDNVTVKLTNGSVSRKELIGGEDYSHLEFKTTFVDEVERIYNNNYEIDLLSTPEGDEWSNFTGELERIYTGSDYEYHELEYGAAKFNYRTYTYRNGQWDDPRVSSGATSVMTKHQVGDYSISWENAIRDLPELRANYPWEHVIATGHPFGDIMTGGGVNYDKKKTIVSFGLNGEEKIYDEALTIPTYDYTRKNGFSGTEYSDFIPNDDSKGNRVLIRVTQGQRYVHGVLFKGGEENAEWTYRGKDMREYDKFYQYSITVEYKKR